MVVVLSHWSLECFVTQEVLTETVDLGTVHQGGDT